MDTQPDNADIVRTPTRNPWLALLSVVVPVLIGVGAGMYLLQQWYIPQFGMGVHQRTVNLGQQLLGKQLPANSILCLGNSVVREGLDTQIAMEQWPHDVAQNWHMYNVSLSGCATLEQRVMLPRMLACQPRVIVLELGIAEIGRSEAIHPDKCYAYARAGFGQNVQADTQLQSIASFSKENRQQLLSSEAEQLLHFRNLPLTSMNENLRRVAQPEFLLEGDTNWVNPFEMAFDYTPDRLQRHLEDLKLDHHVVLQPALREGKTLIRQNLELIQKSGCRPMLVLLPIHPALHDFYLDVDGQNIQREFFDFIRELEKQYQVATWDATKLLPATQFSDALHPNADGRRSYSTALGKWLNQELIPAQEPRPTE